MHFLTANIYEGRVNSKEIRQEKKRNEKAKNEKVKNSKSKKVVCRKHQSIG